MSRGGREAASASMSRWAVTCPAHAPIMWPPTTAASWTRPDEPGRQPRGAGLEERGAEQVGALLERVGDGDHDPLPVDEQVRQVVGDEVADGDRQQPRPDRARCSRSGRPTSAAPTTIAEPGEQEQRLGHEPRGPEPGREHDRLREAVEDDRRDADGDERDDRGAPSRPPRRPLANERRTTWARIDAAGDDEPSSASGRASPATRPPRRRRTAPSG